MTGINRHKSLKRLVTREVSNAPLVSFRILFGLMMFVSTVRFWTNGWIETQYIDPSFYFPFFSWAKPLPAWGMYGVFALMAISSLGICIGWFYRFSAGVFFLLFTYVEMIDKTNYLNHYYFVSLLAFLMVLLPAHRRASLDVRSGRVSASRTCAAVYPNVLKLQLAVVYFFSGVAKINTDWLVNAQPMKMWLAAHVHKPVLGFLFRFEATAYCFSWAGMLYDVCVSFFLSWKKSLPYAYATVVVFHLMTWWLFPIGMFPFIMIATTTIFFPARWHERLYQRTVIAKPALTETVRSPDFFSQRLIRSLFMVFFAVQLLFPFRYLLYPGDLFWTEQGYRFSWRVMLMEKAGHATFIIEDRRSGKRVQAANYEYLTPRQEKMMATQPDMILQFACFLKEEYRQKGFADPKVTVQSFVTLNGRRSRPFIDPHVDLTRTRDGWHHKAWILAYE